MKNIRLMIILLALGVGVVDGCNESNQPAEKAAAPATQTAESAGQMPADMKEAVPAKVAEPMKDAAEETAVAVATQAAESAGKMQAEVQEAASAKVAEPVKVAAEETAAAASGVVEEAMKEAAASPIDIEKGASIFKSKCTACHGVGGKGSAMAPAFTGNEWTRDAESAEIAGVIKNGRQGPEKIYKNFVIGMPAFKQMPDSDVDAVVAYIKSIN